MQILKTNSIRPQNKVGLPIGVSDLMFLNIIHLSKNRSDKTEIKIKNNKVVHSSFFFFFFKKKNNLNTTKKMEKQMCL